jgi:hypothetical protein
MNIKYKIKLTRHPVRRDIRINRTVIVAMLLKRGDIMATKMAWGVI